MGLDSYLKASKYIGGYEHSGATEKALFLDIVNLTGAGEIYDRSTPSLTVSVTVAYWRKANHIHKWFVDACQGGEDDCRTAYVRKEELQELLDDCRSVLADHSRAEELLPTEEGFFFGGSDYGADYYADIEDTIKQLTPLLQLEGYDFYYHASW